MPELEDLAALSLAQTRERLASNVLPVGFARVYSQHVRLRAGQEELPTWSAHEFEQRLSDVVALIDAADIAKDSGEDPQPSYRRAAELLEWLDHPRIKQGNAPFSALGAACYHLAGFPARASTLAARPAASTGNALLQHLLRGDFPRLFWEAPDAASSQREWLRTRESWSHSDWYMAVVREVASSLGVIAADFRWGNEARRSSALAKLQAAARALRRFGDPYTWLIVKLVAEVTQEMTEVSLRVPVSGLAETASADGQQACESYVRQRFLDRRSLAWPSQTRGLRRLTLGDSFALCTPTGSGKTTVAEIALLDGLFQAGAHAADTAPLCLYIVPTRALAAEVESKLGRALRRSGAGRPITVTGLYGGTDWGPTDAWLAADEPTVLICTQEKADALIRFIGGSVVSRLTLVIIDEAHEVAASTSAAALIAGEDRALRLETLVARLRAFAPANGTRFIAMSAVAADIETPLASWIKGEERSAPVRSDYRSTRQVIGRLVCAAGYTRIVYDVLEGSRLTVGRGETEAFVPRPFPRVPPSADMSGAQKSLAPYALWAAASLASESEDAPGQSVLVSIASGVRNWATWTLKLLDQWADVTPTFFTEPETEEELSIWRAAQDACDDYFGVNSVEGQLLARGVAVHYGRMPGRLPRLMVQLIERRVVRVVLATSGLSQGVNLPFETVIVPLLRRQNARMERSEFWNLVGRAGRPGVSTEGQTLVVVNDDDHTTWRRRQTLDDYGYLIRGVDDAGRNRAHPLADLLLRLRSYWPAGADEEFFAWLETTAPLELPGADEEQLKALDAVDATLLAVLEEGDVEDSASSREEAARQFWRATFSRYAAAEEQRLESILLRRARALGEIYSDRSQRRRLYVTSLPPRDAVRLQDIAQRLRDHLASGGDYAQRPWDERLTYVLDSVRFLADHPKFAPRARVGNSRSTWRDVLQWWLTGWRADVSPTPTQAGPWHDFINANFTYRFNWALGSTLSLLSSDLAADDSRGFDLSNWESTGLPWIAIWLKDLIEWGTLDPVAAYLLARGGAHTRPDAEAMASHYYTSDEALALDDPLDPNAVRRWAASVAAERGVRPEHRHPVPLEATPIAALREGEAAERSWPVVPSASGSDGSLRWLDPSGRILASSDAPEVWDERWAENYDFTLAPKERIVTARTYA